jgi:hypothetical protein
MGKYLLMLVGIKVSIQKEYLRYTNRNKYIFLNLQRQILKYLKKNLKIINHYCPTKI